MSTERQPDEARPEPLGGGEPVEPEHIDGQGEAPEEQDAETRLKELRRRRRRRRLREGSKVVAKVLAVVSVFTFVLFFDRIVHRILPGERGVLWELLGGGTLLTKSYREGIMFTFPWDEFYIYDLRVQELRQETVIYAGDGLEIRVLTSTRFRPRVETLPELHVRIGPAYIEKVVKPEIVSTLRQVLGDFTPEMIYAKDEAGLVGELLTRLRQNLDPHFFEVSEFIITELRLPHTIEAAIKDKLTEEQKMLSYRFRIEKEKDERERRVIEAEGVRAFETISGVPILKWRGIEATEKLAESKNAKIILMGTGEGQLPVILNADVAPPPDETPGESSKAATEAADAAEAGDGPLPEMPSPAGDELPPGEPAPIEGEEPAR